MFLLTYYVLFSVQKQMLELLEGWLRHKSDMVNFEAARVICEMKNVSTVQLSRAIGGKNHHVYFVDILLKVSCSAAAVLILSKGYFTICFYSNFGFPGCNATSKCRCM